MVSVIQLGWCREGRRKKEWVGCRDEGGEREEASLREKCVVMGEGWRC